jgi:hypothetical protein
MKFTVQEYITNLFNKNQSQFPHTTQRQLNTFISRITNLSSDIQFRNYRDLRVTRKFLLEKLNWSMEQKELIDLCFPNDLGPFGDRIFLSMCPANAKRIENGRESDDAFDIPSAG